MQEVQFFAAVGLLQKSSVGREVPSRLAVCRHWLQHHGALVTGASRPWTARTRGGTVIRRVREASMAGLRSPEGKQETLGGPHPLRNEILHMPLTTGSSIGPLGALLNLPCQPSPFLVKALALKLRSPSKLPVLASGLQVSSAFKWAFISAGLAELASYRCTVCCEAFCCG